MGYTVGSFTQLFIEGQVRRILGKMKMEKIIRKLSNHYIVCGYGRIGQHVCRELKDRMCEVVIIENKPEAAEQAEREGFLVIYNDATNEDILQQAGLCECKALIAATGSDANNVFITLSAKELAPDVFVIVRAEAFSSEKKLLRAGADRVVSPDIIGGKKMAMIATTPNVIEFMDVVTLGARTEFCIVEIIVKDESPIVGETLKGLNFHREMDVLIIGIKKANNEFLFKPSPNVKISAGDILIAVGTKAKLENLSSLTAE